MGTAAAAAPVPLVPALPPSRGKEGAAAEPCRGGPLQALPGGDGSARPPFLRRGRRSGGSARQRSRLGSARGSSRGQGKGLPVCVLNPV